MSRALSSLCLAVALILAAALPVAGTPPAPPELEAAIAVAGTGSDEVGGDRLFVGPIHDVQLYDTALTTAELRAPTTG